MNILIVLGRGIMKFVGRARELEELERLYQQGSFQMVVLYGRRRVGKTTLAAAFAQGKPTLSFTAKIQSDALNLRDFSRKIYEWASFPVSTGAFPSWEEALAFVARQAGDTHLIFVFDEFPYAASKNEGLISALQVVIDHLFSKTNIFLILTGSNQGFMEERVMGEASDSRGGMGAKNPLFGRRTAQIHLAPFDYADAARMLPNSSLEDLVRYYACVGGTPHYLAGIDEGLTFEENIANLFFSKEGLLYEEPLMLLRQELREPALYSSILDAVACGANRPQAIADRIGENRTAVGKYLGTLSQLHLVKKVVPFGENPKTSRKGIYALHEPSFAFWYRFVAPYADAIELDAGAPISREVLGGEELNAYVGLWFEEMCLQWVVLQAREEHLPFVPLRFGRWWGANPTTKQQEDIDVVADSRIRSSLLIGECKWRNSFNESDEVAKLRRRAALLGSYRDTWLALFTKHDIAPATRKKFETEGNWLLVDTERLYAQVR